MFFFILRKQYSVQTKKKKSYIVTYYGVLMLALILKLTS